MDSGADPMGLREDQESGAPARHQASLPLLPLPRLPQRDPDVSRHETQGSPEALLDPAHGSPARLVLAQEELPRRLLGAGQLPLGQESPRQEPVVHGLPPLPHHPPPRSEAVDPQEPLGPQRQEQPPEGLFPPEALLGPVAGAVESALPGAA